jgi:hypothetical protein
MHILTCTVDFHVSVYFKFIIWGAILMVNLNIVKYNIDE